MEPTQQEQYNINNMQLEITIGNEVTNEPTTPNPINRLRNTPRIPPLSANFPDSWIRLLDEWEKDYLNSFEGYGRRTHFSLAEKQRYFKRLRAMQQLRRISRNRNQTERETATSLDIERNIRVPPITIHTHLQELNMDDLKIVRRNRM